MTVNGTRCCARCRTPFGHSAVAGICCHPAVDVVEQHELMQLHREAGVQPPRPGKVKRSAFYDVDEREED